METIGKRIRRLRIERGFTRQVEFAPLVLMTQSSLSDVESKDKEFSAKQMLALCRVLQVSPDYLMEGGKEEDMGSLELLRIYKNLQEAEREMLVRMARGLVADLGNRKQA